MEHHLHSWAIGRALAQGVFDGALSLRSDQPRKSTTIDECLFGGRHVPAKNGIAVREAAEAPNDPLVLASVGEDRRSAGVGEEDATPLLHNRFRMLEWQVT